MRRNSAVRMIAASLVLALSATACAPGYYSNGSSSTYMGFSVGVSNAPPPPRLYFRSEPRFRLTISSGVRVVDAPDTDCDLFLYGGTYYMYSEGYWYRSRAYDGDYALIEVRRVPRAVLEVPERHWRHHPGRGHARGHYKGDRGRGRW